MPVHSTPAAISAYEGREEALKTAWVNSAYPALPSPLPKLDVPFFTSSNVDPNGLLGLNPVDGSWSLSKLYDWSSWKRPIVEKVHSQQLEVDSGVRVTWSVRGGDIFRTGFIVKINTDGTFPVGAGISGTVVRHAGEFNSSDPDLKLKYSLVTGPDGLLTAHVQASRGGWNSFNDFGGYGEVDGEPNVINFPDATDPTKYPDPVVFSAIFKNITVATGDFIDLGIVVIPVDGRQFHTLSTTQDTPSLYTTTENPSSGVNYAALLKGPVVQNTYFGNQQGTSVPGNGIIRIYNTIGAIQISDITHNSFMFTPEYVFNPYFASNGFNYWVYVTDDTTNLSHPYYPADGQENNPYDGYGADDYTTPSLNRWILFNGFLSDFSGLSASTTYNVYMTIYRDGDLGSQAGFSAPDQGAWLRTVSSDQISTIAAPASQLPGIAITSAVGNGTSIAVQWDHDYACNYVFQYSFNGGTYKSAPTSGGTNWNSLTNPKSATAFHQLTQPGDTISLRMMGYTGADIYSGQTTGWVSVADYTNESEEL